MRHRATPNFWYRYRLLPADIRDLADRCYELLKENPHYPSLHFKKVGKLWSVRIGSNYRALAIKVESDLVWFWIGSHDEYDRLLQRN